MIYIFEDGRIFYGEENLPLDSKNYIAVETLPPIPPKDGMTGYFYAKDGKLETGYFETPTPPEDDLPAEPAKPITLEELNEKIDLALGGLIDIFETVLSK